MATAAATKEVRGKADETAKTTGRITQIIGPVLDVEFEPEQLPELLNAILIEDSKAGLRVVAEVQQHIGQNQVRAVAMSSTDGLVRGMPVTDLGGPISAPVG